MSQSDSNLSHRLGRRLGRTGAAPVGRSASPSAVASIGLALLGAWLAGAAAPATLAHRACAAGPFAARQDETGTEDDVPTAQLSIGEREPFDRIHLNAENDNAILETQPLELPGGVVPEKPETGSWLRFRLLDRPQHLFEVPWAAIVKVERYQDMLLAEAREFVAARDFDKAYPAVARLMRDYPKTRGLDRMRLEFLYVNARQMLDREKIDEALTVLDELDRVDREFRTSVNEPTVAELLRSVLDRIVGRYVEQGEFDRAENYMTLIAAKYGDSQKPVIERWEGEIRAVAIGYMNQAKASLEAGDGRGAHQAVRKMFGILRDLDGGTEVAEEVLRRFPLVLVAVSQTSNHPDPLAIEGWANRRLGAMSYRTLLDYRGQGQDGGVYELTHGRLTLSEDRRTLTFDFDASPIDPLRPPVDIYDLSRRLFDLADPNEAVGIPAWARLLERLEIENANRLRVDLRFPHVLPESLISGHVLPRVADSLPPADGLYAPLDADPQARERRYAVRPSFRDAAERNWPEIVEQVYDSHLDAVTALQRSDIDVIEQVFPADVPRLRGDSNLIVDRYQLPVQHLLVPNRRNVLMKFPAFRRALLYGINRDMILNQVLLGGASLEGAALTSGPFPLGIDESDPLNYAYDFRLEPLPYEPRLGQALVGLSKIQFKDQLEAERVARGEAAAVETAEEPPIRLVLAYPHGDVPRLACDAMVKQLKQLGIEVVLRPLPLGETRPADDDWDLLFTEVVMVEPLTDARRLLSERGLARIDLAPIDLALRRLDTAESWSRARRALYELHLLVYNDVSVIPLWQLPVYQARRKGLEGVGSNTRSLYENLDRWELTIGSENRP